MYLLFCRFIYHVARQTEGVHWGVHFLSLIVLLLVSFSYSLSCHLKPRLSRSVLLRNVVMMVGAFCFLVAVIDLTLGRRVGEAVIRNPELTVFSWIFDSNSNKFKQFLYALFNIALFMPVAAFLSAMWDRQGNFVSESKVLFLLVIGSIAVELSQSYFHLGYFQLEDVVCNSIGIVAGIYIGRCASRTRAEIEQAI